MGDLSHHEGQVQNLDGQLGHSDRAVIVIGDIQDTLGRKTGKGRGESNHPWQEEVKQFKKTPSLIEPHPSESFSCWGTSARPLGGVTIN